MITELINSKSYVFNSILEEQVEFDMQIPITDIYR